LIRGAGHAVVYQATTAADWDRALREPSDIVAVAGGDGIVGQVAKRVIGHGLPIAVLPMGTANNIANALGLLDRPIHELISGWTTARHQTFDTGIAVGPWGRRTFLEGLGVGLFADTMFRLDARKNVDIAHLNESGAKIAAVLEIMRARLDHSPAHFLNLALDAQDLSGEYILVEAMNIRSIGPNLDLAPAADPRDGLFDIVLVSKDELPQIREFLNDRLGKQIKPRARRGRQLRIDCPSLRIHIDDDLWPEMQAKPCAAAVEIHIEPESLFMLTPV
jgi:diacylglycerol kinase family enzyme